MLLEAGFRRETERMPSCKVGDRHTVFVEIGADLQAARTPRRGPREGKARRGAAAYRVTMMGVIARTVSAPLADCARTSTR